MARPQKRETMKTKKLPEMIYGYWHNDGSDPDDAFIRTSDNPSDLVETGETIRVGIYRLSGYAEIHNMTETTVVSASRNPK